MKQKNVQLEALIDSKKEYLDHLFDLITEPMVVTFQDIYQQCLQSPETRKKGILTAFQDALVSVSSWNNHLIQEHYQKVVAHTGCKYIPDLVRALISVQVKINLIANTVSTSNNIKLRIPSAENFVHRCYVDVARAVWKRPYLLYHNVRSVEKQQNLLDLEKIIHQSIRTTLRGFVPMEQLIAQAQVMDIPIEDNESSSSEEEPESESDEESETLSESSQSDEEESEEDESESEVESVESIVEVVELSEPEPREELQNEVINNDASESEPVNNEIDITVLHEEDIPSSNENVVIEDVDVATTLNEDPTEADAHVDAEDPTPTPQESNFRKSVELHEDEEDDGEVHIDKISLNENMEAPAPAMMESAPAEDRAVPYHMMLMNRKIVHHRPPPSMVIKKKKKDAFF